jgi:ankyrin repeat protein
MKMLEVSDVFVPIKNTTFDYLEPEEGIQNSPLSEACRCGHTEVAKILIEHGAKIRGFHLITASGIGNADLVNLLLDAEFGIIDSWYVLGGMALYCAVIFNSVDVVGVLLSRGVDPNIKEIDGKSVLYVAIDKRRIEIAKLLIEDGRTKLNHTNAVCNRTAIQLASEHGLKEIVEVLLQKGADPNTYSKYLRIRSMTALDYATEKGHTEIATIIRNAGGKRYVELSEM